MRSIRRVKRRGRASACRARRRPACGRRASRAARGRRARPGAAAARELRRASSGGSAAAAARDHAERLEELARARPALSTMPSAHGDAQRDLEGRVARLGVERPRAGRRRRCRRRQSCSPSPTPRYGSSSTMSGAVRATSSTAVLRRAGGADRHEPGLGAQQRHEPGADGRLGVDDGDAGHATHSPRRPLSSLSVSGEYREMRDERPGTARTDQAVRRRPAGPRRRRPGRPRRRVLRPARPERRRQDNAHLRRSATSSASPAARHDVFGHDHDTNAAGAPADRPRRAGRQPRPLPRRRGDAGLPRRLLRHDPPRRPPSSRRDDGRLRPAREGRPRARPSSPAACAAASCSPARSCTSRGW